MSEVNTNNTVYTTAKICNSSTFNFTNCSTTNLLNQTIPEEPSGDETYRLAARYIRNVFIPILVAVGFFGNTLSSTVFCSLKMKRSSCSIFLAALAIVDNLFLISLVLTWIHDEWIAVFLTNFACQCYIFTSYMTSCLSTWFIVGFSAERLFAVCLPMRLNICGTFKEKIAVAVLVITAVSFYQFAFWTVIVQEQSSRSVCTFRTDYFDFLKTATWIDTIIIMIVPYCFILFANAKVWYNLRQRSIALNIRHSDAEIVGEELRVFHRRRSLNRNPSKMLLVVSTSFVLFNLPAHSIRLYHLFSARSGYEVSDINYFCQEIAQMLSYLTFSTNFLLYTLSSQSFKNSLRALFRCK